MFHLNKWERRRDLSGVIIRAATKADPPYVSSHIIVKENLPPGYIWLDQLAGQLVGIGMFYGEIWKSLQYTTNFSYWTVGYDFYTVKGIK